MRYLCIDLGDRRTGIAVGDSVTGLVSPGEVIECPVDRRAGEELLDLLVREVRRQGPTGLVVGLPMNMDGTEGPRAKKVRAFAGRIAAAAALPLDFQDERLTTADADWSMARTGMTRGQKKARRDALAAAAILRDYLSQRVQGGAPDAKPDPNGPVENRD